MTEYNGVKRSTTDILRQLLDERGVEWTANDGEHVKETCWPYMGELTAAFAEYDNGTTRFACDTWCFTPEQAIAATLGRGTCKFEYTLADNGWADHTCSECGYVENLDVHVGLGWHYCPNCGREIVE